MYVSLIRKYFASPSFSNVVINRSHRISLWRIRFLWGHHLWLWSLVILDSLIGVGYCMRILRLLSYHHRISRHVIIVVSHYCIVVDKLVRAQTVIYWLLLLVLWEICILLLWDCIFLIICYNWIIRRRYWSNIYRIMTIIIVSSVLYYFSLLPCQGIIHTFILIINHVPIPEL